MPWGASAPTLDACRIEERNGGGPTPSAATGTSSRRVRHIIAEVWGFADTQKVTADLSCCLKGLMASLIAKEPKSP